MMYVHDHGAVPQFFVDLMNAFEKAMPYTRGPSHYSATGLLRGPLEAALEREHPNILRDALEGIAAIDGTMLHKGLELAAAELKDAVSERRLYKQFQEGPATYVVSAANDLFLPKTEWGDILIDWKRVKAKSVFYMRKPSVTNMLLDGQWHKSDWVYQLNINRLLIESDASYTFGHDFYRLEQFFLEDHGRPLLPSDYTSKWLLDYAQPHLGRNVSRMFIGAFFKDWAPWEAQRSKDYPQAPVQFIEIPRLSDSEVNEYIIGRIKLHETYRDTPPSKIPICSDKERMKQEDTWKVFDMTSKAKSPRSKGNFSNEIDANSLAALEESRTGKPHRVDLVRGVDSKCSGFCNYRHVCQHGREVVQASVWEVESDD